MSDSADTNNPADERRRIDPRFSPAFQPGYDPHTHRREPPSTPLREETTGGWDDGPVDDWAESSGAPAGATAAGANSLAQYSPGLADQRIRAEQAERAEPDVDPAAWWQLINPWIVVLWALGAAFIIGGVAISVAIVGGVGAITGDTFPGYAASALFQMAWFGVPLLIVLGLATITASFVILAIRWRRP